MIKVGQVYTNFIGEELTITKVDQTEVEYQFNLSGVSQKMTLKDFEKNIVGGYVVLTSESGKAVKVEECKHKWVNVSFNSIKEECYYCGKPKL